MVYHRIKAVLKTPKPIGDPQKIGTYTPLNHVVQDPKVVTLPTEWVLKGSGSPQVFTLASLKGEKFTQSLLTYRMTARCELVDPHAYLEIWCSIEEKGIFYARGLVNVIKGSQPPKDYEISFAIKANQVCDQVCLNLVIEGTGVVRITEFSVWKTQLL